MWWWWWWWRRRPRPTRPEPTRPEPTRPEPTCTVPYRTKPCRAVPCRTVPCRTVPCRTVPNRSNCADRKKKKRLNEEVLAFPKKSMEKLGFESGRTNSFIPTSIYEKEKKGSTKKKAREKNDRKLRLQNRSTDGRDGCTHRLTERLRRHGYDVVQQKSHRSPWLRIPVYYPFSTALPTWGQNT